MPTTYELADGDLNDILQAVMQQHHRGLADAEARICVLLAHASTDENGDPVGPAVKNGPYSCAAKVRVTNLKERTLGHADAEIILDGDNYTIWGHNKTSAILDHELSHLEFTGKRDPLDRPKLRLLPHDRQFGWFDAVAERWGCDAVEVEQAATVFEDLDIRQLYLPGFEPEPDEATV